MSGRTILGGMWLLSCLITLISGCDSSTSPDASSGPSMEAMAAALENQKTNQQQEQARLEAEQQAVESQQAAESDPSAAEGSRTVAGRPGVGQGGYYTAIVGARRHVLNRVESLAWTQAVQHFQATNGRLPKDHDEFMSQIVEPLDIDLGYIEENQEFLYDPSEGRWGTLYVVEKTDKPAVQ